MVAVRCKFKGCVNLMEVPAAGGVGYLCAEHYRMLYPCISPSAGYKVVIPERPSDVCCDDSASLARVIAASEDKLLTGWLASYGYTIDDVKSKNCFIESNIVLSDRGTSLYRLFDKDVKLLSTIEVKMRAVPSELPGGSLFEYREIKE